MVEGSLGLPSVGGEGDRWGGPLSVVGESSGLVLLAVERVIDSGLLDEEGGRSG